MYPDEFYLVDFLCNVQLRTRFCSFLIHEYGYYIEDCRISLYTKRYIVKFTTGEIISYPLRMLRYKGLKPLYKEVDHFFRYMRWLSRR